MEEENESHEPAKPSPLARTNGAAPATRRRFSDDDDGAGDKVVYKCSGKACRSCAAAMMADCVALCCCPCAVLNFMALAFVKVPWTVGRRCLALAKRKRKRGKKGGENGAYLVERDEGSRLEKEIESVRELGNGFTGSARFEAEKVWLELYQVGELGFGRVSFTGFPLSAP